MVRLLLPLLALLAVPLPGAAQGHAGHGKSELGASAAFDGAGTLWAAYKEGGRVMLRRSTDLGASWSPPQPVNAAPEPIAADGEGRPKLAAGPAGELYVTWTRPLAKPYTGEIRFTRSLDGGASFEAPRTVHTDRQEITHRFDALAVGPDGRLFVAWIDKRDLEAAKAAGSDYRGAAVYVAVSDDRGGSFQGDRKLADHSCECCRIALLPEADGGLLAFWRHVFAPNIRDHALGRLAPDGSAAFLRRATFDDWRLDACPHHGPSLGRDEQGRLHAVWFTGAPGREGIRYGRLAEGRVEAERVIGGPAAEHADLAVAGRRVALAWKEFDGSRTRLRAALSEDGGDTFRELELAVTEGPSDQPRLLQDKGRFHLLWNTRAQPLSVLSLP